MPARQLARRRRSGRWPGRRLARSCTPLPTPPPRHLLLPSLAPAADAGRLPQLTSTSVSSCECFLCVLILRLDHPRSGHSSIFLRPSCAQELDAAMAEMLQEEQDRNDKEAEEPHSFLMANLLLMLLLNLITTPILPVASYSSSPLTSASYSSSSSPPTSAYSSSHSPCPSRPPPHPPRPSPPRRGGPRDAAGGRGVEGGPNRI